MIKRIKCCLVGFCDHTGVENVGGRIGAATGPQSFRQCFDRFSGPYGSHVELHDLGNIVPVSSNLEETLAAAADAVARVHYSDGRSIVVGGGHDFGYAQLAGVRKSMGSKARIGCINIDAHLDLRDFKPKITSGSPFRMAIENQVILADDLVEFGIQLQSNAPAVMDYAREKKVRILTLDDVREADSAKAAFSKELTRLKKKCDAIVLSVDLDAVSEAWAPGVSAPQADGFSPQDIFSIMTCAGADETVSSLGIFELNPSHDRDQQTARLAATAVHRFLSASST